MFWWILLIVFIIIAVVTFIIGYNFAVRHDELLVNISIIFTCLAGILLFICISNILVYHNNEKDYIRNKYYIENLADRGFATKELADKYNSWLYEQQYYKNKYGIFSFIPNSVMYLEQIKY